MAKAVLISIRPDWVEKIANEIGNWNYCPNCGAKMDLEDKYCDPVESDFCSYGQVPINSIPANQEERWLKTI